MIPCSIQVRERRGQRVFVLASYKDRDNVVCGLPGVARVAVLQGTLRAVEQSIGQGPDAEQRRRDFVDLVAYEILFALVRQRKLAWGLESQAVRDERSRQAFSSRFERQPVQEAEPPYLLDLVDWSHVDPWLGSLNYPKEIRTKYRRLTASLFEQGPFISNPVLHLHAVQRLYEAWNQAWDGETRRAAVQAIGQRRPLPVGHSGIEYRNRCLGAVMEYYGIGEAARPGGPRGFYVAYWRLERVLYALREPGGLDLRDLPWMQGRYLLVEDLPRLPVGDFPLIG